MDRRFVTVVGSYNIGLFYKAPRLPVVGETVIGDSVWEGNGGKGSNQAIAARAFGAPTQFIGRIGMDHYGQGALALYKRYGISTETIRIDYEDHTGISVIFVDKDGANMIMVCPGANYRLCEADIDAAEPAIRRSHIVGFQLENRLAVVDYAIRKTRTLGVTTLLDPAPAVKLPDDLLPFIDYIKPNETEATVLTGIPVTNVATAMRAGLWLVDRGVGTAIVTLGEQGAVVTDGKTSQHYPAPKVHAVDTTGAGDVFCGAILAAFLSGKPVEDAVMFGNHAGALSVTRLGVIDAIPMRDEVDASLHANAALV
ncbi:MAG TPA: ribokinase [Bryobacteraceae bacterium]|jgi:ribokinase